MEPCFLIHFANAYEEGGEVVVQAIGWGPEIVRDLATMQGSGVFGTFSTGDYNKVPVTSLWSHRLALHARILVLLAVDCLNYLLSPTQPNPPTDHSSIHLPTIHLPTHPPTTHLPAHPPHPHICPSRTCPVSHLLTQAFTCPPTRSLLHCLT